MKEASGKRESLYPDSCVETKGCVITQLSPEEKLRFQQAVMPLYEKYCAEYVDIIDEIVAEGW